MAIKLKVPFHSYKDLRKRAADFLVKYNPTSAIPVPIEQIVEFSLGLNVIPIPNLQSALEIDGGKRTPLADWY